MNRKSTLALLVAAALPLLAACGGGDDASASPATVTVTSPAPEPASAPTTSSVPVAPAPAAATTSQPVTSTSVAVDFTMPDMTGKVLQDAQDQLQTLGVFYSTSQDLLGVRHQVLDRDWKVCSQNTPAGQHVTGSVEGQIEFGVVKLSENCP
jgi:hypothetical protein